MTKVKRAEKLFYINIVKSISSIGHNRARFIVHDVDDTFRIYFKKYIKEKEEASKIFRV